MLQRRLAETVYTLHTTAKVVRRFDFQLDNGKLPTLRETQDDKASDVELLASTHLQPRLTARDQSAKKFLISLWARYHRPPLSPAMLQSPDCAHGAEGVGYQNAIELLGRDRRYRLPEAADPGHDKQDVKTPSRETLPQRVIVSADGPLRCLRPSQDP